MLEIPAEVSSPLQPQRAWSLLQRTSRRDESATAIVAEPQRTSTQRELGRKQHRDSRRVDQAGVLRVVFLRKHGKRRPNSKSDRPMAAFNPAGIDLASCLYENTTDDLAPLERDLSMPARVRQGNVRLARKAGVAGPGVHG